MEERETGLECLGCIFSPLNEKQVTVHCKTIWLVGTRERKESFGGALFFLVFSCELLLTALVL